MFRIRRSHAKSIRVWNKAFCFEEGLKYTIYSYSFLLRYFGPNFFLNKIIRVLVDILVMFPYYFTNLSFSILHETKQDRFLSDVNQDTYHFYCM